MSQNLPIEFPERYTPEEQRANLDKLADYLIALPEDYVHFDMEEFNQNQSSQGLSPLETYAQCNTVACAVGHGLAAGILPIAKLAWDVRSWSWFLYCRTSFGIGMREPAGDFLFSADWAPIDNTPRGAGLRIKQYLASGVPDGLRYLYPSQYLTR